MTADITFRSFAIYYLRHCRTYNSKRTLEEKRRYLQRLIYFFGTTPINEIRKADVYRYIQNESRKQSNLTINRSLSVLKHLLNYAMAMDLIEKNPVKGVKFLPEEQKPITVPSRQMVAAWLAWCVEHDPLLYDLSAIAVNTGLRRGDILKIQGEDIDLDRRMLCVAVSKTKGVQYVPLNDVALGILSRRKRAGYIFVNGDTHLKGFRRRFARAKRETGLPCRFHDFRHFAATEMLYNGVDTRTIQKVLGHARLSTTERYLAVTESRVRAAVETLNVNNPAQTPRTTPLPFHVQESLWAMGDLNLRPPACKAGALGFCFGGCPA